MPIGNINCLQGWKCPECGEAESFRISPAVITTSIILTDDGTDNDGGDTSWERNADCKCMDCGHEGEVWQFDGDGPLKTPDKTPEEYEAIIKTLVGIINDGEQVLQEQAPQDLLENEDVVEWIETAQNTVLQYTIGKPVEKLQVKIDVYGGVADVTECPAGVEVTIEDHDHEQHG